MLLYVCFCAWLRGKENDTKKVLKGVFEHTVSSQSSGPYDILQLIHRPILAMDKNWQKKCPLLQTKQHEQNKIVDRRFVAGLWYIFCNKFAARSFFMSFCWMKKMKKSWIQFMYCLVHILGFGHRRKKLSFSVCHLFISFENFFVNYFIFCCFQVCMFSFSAGHAFVKELDKKKLGIISNICLSSFLQ